MKNQKLGLIVAYRCSIMPIAGSREKTRREREGQRETSVVLTAEEDVRRWCNAALAGEISLP